MYMIIGKYQGMLKEVIDECDSKPEADRLLDEYRLAFGSDWTIWIVRCE